MGRPQKPKYRRQKRDGRTDLAFIEIQGERIYLGEYNSPESKAEYRRLAAEVLTAGSRSMFSRAGSGGFGEPEDSPTVTELIAAFWKHAEIHYRHPDGTQSSELANFRSPLRVLREFYGHTRVEHFGPRALKAVRQGLIERGLSRGYVNSSVSVAAQVEAFGDEAELEERKSRLKKCVDKLSEANRELVTLRYFDDVAYEEIEKRTGRTRAALYMAFGRIHRSLADCLGLSQ